MKQFQVEVEEGTVCIVRKNALAKRVSITINARSGASATVPWWISKKKAISFVKQNKQWILDKLAKAREMKAESLLQLGDHDDYLLHKENARKFVLQKLEYYNQFYDFPFQRVAIRDHRTRWGSCSGKRNLNFNYRIIHLPIEHADYLIVHELCHLKQMNHSSHFWELVSRAIPEYRKISRELRKM